jgi:hypothetical protein
MSEVWTFFGQYAAYVTQTGMLPVPVHDHADCMIILIQKKKSK